MSMRFVSYGGALSIVICFFWSLPATGATASASLNVSVTVEPVCLVSSATTSYKTVASAMASAPAGVSVSCNFDTPYNVTLTRRATSGNAKSVTNISAADLSTSDTEEAAAVYGPLVQRWIKSTVDSVQHSNHSMLPTGSGVVEKTVDNEPSRASDTIVVEVSY
jgi:spore coat protein U-like protein